MIRSFLWKTVFLGLTLCLAGCPSQNSVRVNTQSGGGAEQSKPGQLDLETGLELLESISDVGSQRTPELVAHHLNEWLDTQPKTEKWAADPLISRIPSTVKQAPSITHIDRLQFDSVDIGFLENRRLLYEVSRWVVAKQAGQPLIPPTNPKLDFDGNAQLQVGLTLFDWIIRNVQLDPDRVDTEESTPALKVGEKAVAGANLPPSAKGLAGVGYIRPPRQCLFMGHGDAMSRAWIFIDLCRQARIDVVLLTVEIDGNPRPWCCGMLLGNQVCLFDPRLGLPIPLPNQKGIATLEDVVADPTILDQLDIDATSQYPVKAAELKSVNAMICATGEELSRRMAMLEAAAPAKYELVVSARPSGTVERLKEVKHLGPYINLWRVPFDAVLYQIARMRQIGPPDTNESYAETLAFNNGNLAQGRTNHLQGKFDGDERNPGALKMYLAARAPESQLKLFEKSSATQEDVDATLRRIESAPATAVGELIDLMTRIFPYEPKEAIPEMVKRLPDEKGALQQVLREAIETASQNLRNMALTARRAKHNANIWVGLMEFDNGKLEVAHEWLKNRTLGDTEETPWTSGARYALSRLHEAKGEFAQAIEYLESDVTSPQRQGNIIRARILRAKQAPSR